MTLDDALRELDVAADASQEDIRRAYLRLVRTTKPERDSAAFMRVREAYEVLTGVRQIAELVHPTEPIVVEPELRFDDTSSVVEFADATVPFDIQALRSASLSDAARLAREYFEHRHSSDESQSQAPLGDAIAIALRLHSGGAVAEARHLTACIVRWVVDRDARVLLLPHLLRWSRLRDLEADASLPAAVRSVLADYALDDDFDLATSRLRDVTRGRPVDADRLAQTIRQSMPAYEPLMSAIELVSYQPDATLDREGTTGGTANRGCIWRLLSLGVVFVTALICLQVLYRGGPPPPSPRGSAEDETLTLIHSLRGLHLDEAARLVDSIERAAEERRCAEARAALAQVPTTLREAPPTALQTRTQFARFISRVAARCPSPLAPDVAASAWPFPPE